MDVLIIAIIVIIIVIFLLMLSFGKESYKIGFKEGKRDLNDLFKDLEEDKPPKKKDEDERVEHHFDMDGKLKRVCWVMPGDGKGEYQFPPKLLQEVQKYYPYAEYTKHNDNQSHIVTISLHDEKDRLALVSYNLKKGAWYHCAWGFDEYK